MSSITKFKFSNSYINCECESKLKKLKIESRKTKITTISKTYTIAKAKEGEAVTGATGAAGADSKVVHLTVDDYTITYDSSGANPSPSGNMTLTATSQNFTDAYFKFTGDGISDEGSYGDCEETGEPIGIKRLEARPVATLCLEAQEMHEKKEKKLN